MVNSVSRIGSTANYQPVESNENSFTSRINNFVASLFNRLPLIGQTSQTKSLATYAESYAVDLEIFLSSRFGAKYINNIKLMMTVNIDGERTVLDMNNLALLNVDGIHHYCCSLMTYMLIKNKTYKHTFELKLEVLTQDEPGYQYHQFNWNPRLHGNFSNYDSSPFMSASELDKYYRRRCSNEGRPCFLIMNAQGDFVTEWGGLRIGINIQNDHNLAGVNGWLRVL